MYVGKMSERKVMGCLLSFIQGIRNMDGENIIRSFFTNYVKAVIINLLSPWMKKDTGVHMPSFVWCCFLFGIINAEEPDLIRVNHWH